MVSTIHIKTNSDKIDLDMISGCIPNSAYNKKRVAAITIRIDAPKTTVLLFSSGKLIITGASSKQMAIAAIRSTMYMLSAIFPRIGICLFMFLIYRRVFKCTPKHSQPDTDFL